MRYRDIERRERLAWGMLVAAVVVFFCLMAVFSVSCSSGRMQSRLVESHNLMMTDSLEMCILRALALSTVQREKEVSNTEREIGERVVLDEHGDTTRHDTHVMETTDRSRELEIENNALRVERDSLRALKARVDSVDRPVPYPVEVVKEVVKPLMWWQKALMWVGGIALVALLVSAVRKLR